MFKTETKFEKLIFNLEQYKDINAPIKLFFRKINLNDT